VQVVVGWVFVIVVGMQVVTVAVYAAAGGTEYGSFGSSEVMFAEWVAGEFLLARSESLAS
jgi:hypothetical protein